jgi:site-specific DNA-cytosine methylase
MGDMTKFKEWNLGPIDLFCGGTPCQSFSVAGLRKGLDDPRGNLMLTYLAIADKFRPRWLVWENVPGVLSSNGGRDFGAFLGGLGQLGYGFAYRVLDAQYFGVAQRRRRVFVVGYLGDWRPAAAVLFERDSLRGNPAPSRKAREVTPTLTKECTGVSRPGHNEDGWYIASTLTKNGAGGQNFECGETYIPTSPSYGIPGNWIGRKPENGGNAVEPMHDVAPCLTKTDQHGVAQAIPIDSMNHLGRNNAEHSLGDFVPGAPSYTLTKQHSHAVAQPIAFDLAHITSKTNASRAEPGLPTGTLCKGSDMHVAQPICLMDQGGSVMSIENDMTGTLRRETHGHEPIVMQPMAYNIAPGKGKLKDDIHVTDAYATKTIDASGSNPAMHQGGAAILHPTIVHGTQDPCVSDIAFAQGRNNGGENVLVQPIGCFKGGQGSAAGGIGYDEHVSPSLTAADSGSNRTPALMQGMAVRRLLPVECERLQGFPDHYTDIKPKGKPTPDGPRYKALGNSWAVPVVRWIGERIMMVEGLK